jgi:hypothetical protein
VPLWNNPPEDPKSSTSTATLKYKPKNHYRVKPETFFDVDRPRTRKTICSKRRPCSITCCS